MLKYVETFDDIIELVRWFESNQHRKISLDIESTSADTYNPNFKVRTIQFGNPTEAWVLPFEPWRGVVQHLIDAHPCNFLIHHSAFEHPSLEISGIHIPWTKIDDTMLSMRIAEPHRPSGLKDAASRHVSRAAANAQRDLAEAKRKNKWGWDTIPIDFPAYVHYAAMDVILTSRLAETAICKTGFASPIYGLEMDYRALCCILEKNGIRFDIGLCQEAKDTFLSEITEITAYTKDKYNISLTSNGQLGHWLVENKAPMTKATAGGGVSVDEDSLSSARESLSPGQDEVAEVLDLTLRRRKLSRLSGTYLSNILDGHTEGVIRPTINTLQARTGRSSITGILPFQTLPRGDSEESKVIRRSVIPRNEGELLISCDMDQVELRMIANLSKDPGLIEAFHAADGTGIDIFTSTSRIVFDEPNFNKSDSRRTGIKTLFYTSAYGAGISKMAATANMPVEEMRAIADKVFSKFPGIKLLMKKCELTARENDWWITTPWGRKLPVNPDKPYVAMNSLIQGFCGEMLKKSMVDMGQAGLAEYICLPIHDEVLLSVPIDEVEDARPVIRECMNYRDMVVPLLAEPSKGCLNWALAK